MKINKLLLAVVAAGVLLGAFVSSAFARNFSISSQTRVVLWRRMDFGGGFGTVECEVKFSGSFHTRTLTKTVNSLIGYITEATVVRCARGGATITQSSLPWHRRYAGFAGTLPNITSFISANTGFSATYREPIFGSLCNTVGSGGSVNLTASFSSGVLGQMFISGTLRCGELQGTFSGGESNVTNGAGARLTVSLI